MKKYFAMIGLVLVTVIWGGGFVASDMALESLTPFQIITGRFFLASLLMGILSWKKLSSMTRDEIRAGILMGITLFAGFALQIVWKGCVKGTIVISEDILVSGSGRKRQTNAGFLIGFDHGAAIVYFAFIQRHSPVVLMYCSTSVSQMTNRVELAVYLGREIGGTFKAQQRLF